MKLEEYCGPGLEIIISGVFRVFMRGASCKRCAGGGERREGRYFIR